MNNPLARKLAHFAHIPEEGRALLDALASERQRRFEPREDIIREGQPPRHVNLLLSGWACRYKSLEDGRRQIVSVLLPGDLCNFNVFMLREMDHSIGALTPVTLVELPRDTLEDVALRHTVLGQALWWESLVNIAIQREWTLNIGQRTAFERVAHLLCELFVRLRSVGLASAMACEFPLTQAELGDATGLSAVHVNRTLQELRAAGLIILRDRRLTIPNFTALKRAGLFNPNYLHLDENQSNKGNNG